VSNPESSYINTREASALTGLSCAWFERARWSGEGPPFVKLGAAVRYPLDELHAFMRSRLRVSTTDEPAPIGGEEVGP
jgi:predicted DNA-binding transcriptional regulator AlpA